jgi:hypothetical protein
MSKMGSHDQFGYLKHKLWQNEWSGVKLPIWLPTTKSKESPRFIFMQVAWHIPLENSWKWIQLFLRPHLNWRFVKEVMGLQSCGSPNFENFGTPNLGIPRQNDIWVLDPWPSTKNTIRGKVVASPKFGSWWILWVYICSWLVRALKVLQLCTKQLIVWFVQVRVSNWLACHSS